MFRRYSGSERRQFQRARSEVIVLYKVDAPIQVSVTVGDKEISAIMLDLSEGGFSILTNKEIPQSTVVTTRFILVNDQVENESSRLRSLEAKGEVRYNLLTKDSAYRTGVQFVGISDADRQFIREFVTTMSRRR